MSKPLAILTAAGLLTVQFAGEAVAATRSRHTSRSRTRVARRGHTAVRTASRRNPFGRNGRRGAYSSRPMRSKEELITCLNNDPTFRHRLAAQFRMTDQELLSYAEDNLQFFKLQHAQRSTVYGMSRTGQVFRVQQNLPAGTPMFGLPGGYGVIKAVCGNPRIIGPLPPPPYRPGRPSAIIPPPTPEVALVPPTPIGVIPTAPFLPPNSVPLPPPELVQGFTPLETITTAEMTPVTGIVPPIPGGGGGFFIPPIIPPFWLIGGGGGGGTTPLAGSGVVTGQFPPPGPKPPFPPPPSQVPEGPSVVLLAAGIGPLIYAVRRRRPEKAAAITLT